MEGRTQSTFLYPTINQLSICHFKNVINVLIFLCIFIKYQVIMKLLVPGSRHVTNFQFGLCIFPQGPLFLINNNDKDQISISELCLVYNLRFYFRYDTFHLHV